MVNPVNRRCDGRDIQIAMDSNVAIRLKEFMFVDLLLLFYPLWLYELTGIFINLEEKIQTMFKPRTYHSA